MATQNDELPTMPSSEAPPVDQNDTVVWLVSYDETDDRELTRPQIAAALARGEIDGDTIVWREGQEDWLAISAVPALAGLLPASGETKNVGEAAPLGFLGTGLALKSDDRERKSAPPPLPRKSEPPKAETAAESPAPTQAVEGPRKSVPPPLPKARNAFVVEDEAPLSVDPESLGPESFAEALMSAQALPKARALSGGTFGVSEKAAGTASDSTASTASHSDSSTPAESASSTTADSAPASAPPESEPPPSSGTPSLMSLAMAPVDDKQEVDDEILALGAGTTAPGLMPPPNIDISDIERTAQNSLTPPAEVPASEPPPPASTTQRPAGASPSRAASTAAPARSPVVPWLIAGTAVVGALYAFTRHPSPPPDPPQVVQPTTPVVVPPQPTVVPTPAATPVIMPTVEATNNVVATATSPAPSTSAQKNIPPVSTASKTNEPQSKPTASASAATSAPAASATAAPTASEGASAPAAPAEQQATTPFDKDAATVSLTATAAEAAACRKEGDPSGRTVVHVTFANSGRAVRATVEGPPFAGTATGGCIAQVMRKAQVPPFSGDKVTVAKTVNVD